MNERVRVARRVQCAAASVAAVLAVPTYGRWLLFLVVLAGALLALLERVYRSSPRPERWAFASMVALELILGAAVTGTGGTHSVFVPFLAVPTLMLAARFRPTVMWVGVAGTTLISALVMTLALVLPPVPPTPTTVSVVGYAGVLASLVAISSALLTAEMQSRGDAVVDPLTGLFNRAALTTRFADAAEQARVLHGPVSVVLCDLDHFKAVNDAYGHAHGDVVLREAADRLRRTLRTYDQVYRYGGEEFVLLLPGHDAEAAWAVAERVVLEMAATAVGGLDVTTSAGVATGVGADLDLAVLLSRADAALYRAKAAGRNRVLAAV